MDDFWGFLRIFEKLRKNSFGTNGLKKLKVWGGDEDLIFQIENETLRIINAKHWGFLGALGASNSLIIQEEED